ncbi:hypothetical protein MJO29_011701 [Puccinia striiformis f. sp. tritici]|nr:hypothetical protein MJO29_011701 [Puccinia striiformis f. sp. tritici]
MHLSLPAGPFSQNFASHSRISHRRDQLTLPTYHMAKRARELPAMAFKRSADYSNTDSLDSQAIDFLQKHHLGAHVERVDIDIMATFLMQEFNPAHHIEKIIEMIQATFTETQPPRTTLQHQIVEAASKVQTCIEKYRAKSPVDPNLQKPFCLRFPTYNSFIRRSFLLEQKCKVLPNSMVILIDEGGVCVGIGLPPKPPTMNSIHIPRDVRATMCLDQFVSTNVLQAREDQIHRIGIDSSEVAPNHPTSNVVFPSTPFPLSLKTRGEVRASSEAKPSTCSFQAYGYGLGNPLSAGAADKSIPLATHSIKADLLQGRNLSSEPEPHLPEPLRSETGLTFQGLVQLRHDVVFYSRISYWINKIFLPESSAVAEKNIQYLIDQGSTASKEAIENENNRILAARTVSVNTQPYTHRDRNNALLMDSVFFFGNHKGGEFLLPSLGLAYHGLQGYSFHGPFRILLHGVAQFHFSEDEICPRRYSVAMWGRASSFAAIARHSAYKDKDQNGVFSNKKLWMPILPKYERLEVTSILEKESNLRQKRGRKKPKVQAEGEKEQEKTKN